MRNRNATPIIDAVRAMHASEPTGRDPYNHGARPNGRARDFYPLAQNVSINQAEAIIRAAIRNQKGSTP